MPPATGNFPAATPTPATTPVAPPVAAVPPPTPVATPAPAPTLTNIPALAISTPVITTVAPVAAAPMPMRATVQQSSIRVQTPVQSPAPRPIVSPAVVKPINTLSPRVGPGNVIRIRSPLVTSVASVTSDHASPTVATAGQSPSAMSGIAALAAAAAATPKINMNNIPGNIITQTTNTVRMKAVQPGQQIRFAAPGSTVLRTASPQQSKQIILQKPGQNITGQPQIVHLLKTGQGMMATVPKVSLIPGKAVQTPGGKPLNQGPTILRLVNPNTVAGSKILTTMKGSNLVAMSKGQGIAGKQTIMITKPGGNGGLVGRTNQIIVVTTGSGLRAVQAVTTSQAGQGGAITNPVNVLPLSAANHVSNQQGVKMIVVSSGAMGGGTSGKPITITVPGHGGVPKTVTIATKGSQQTIFNPGKSQLMTMPQLQKAQDAVTGKPVTLQMSSGLGTKTVTLMPTSSSIVTTSVSADSIDTSKMLFVPQKQPSASLASTSDGPATTDAALAALAAEAGLIDPVQESSGLSFLVTDDGTGAEEKAEDSCNGNEATTTAALVSQLGAGEPMQVDGDGNFVIPQVDGPGDIFSSDDEDESPEQNDAEPPQHSVASPTPQPQENQDMEQDVYPSITEDTPQVEEAADTQEQATEAAEQAAEVERAGTETNAEQPMEASESDLPSESDMQIVSNAPSEASLKSEPSESHPIETVRTKTDRLEDKLEAETEDKHNVNDDPAEESERNLENAKTDNDDDKQQVSDGDDEFEKLNAAVQEEEAKKASSMQSLKINSEEPMDTDSSAKTTPIATTSLPVVRQIKLEQSAEQNREKSLTASVTNGRATAEPELNHTPKTNIIVKPEPMDEASREVSKPDKENNTIDSNDDSTALTTLATAALGSAEQPLKVKPELAEEEKKDLDWYDVGVIKGTTCTVQHYFLSGDKPLDVTLPMTEMFKGRTKLPLESGTAYKFRVAAINSCGKSVWSEVKRNFSLKKTFISFFSQYLCRINYYFFFFNYPL